MWSYQFNKKSCGVWHKTQSNDPIDWIIKQPKNALIP
jgi:hypothetical protein